MADIRSMILDGPGAAPPERAQDSATSDLRSLILDGPSARQDTPKRTVIDDPAKAASVSDIAVASLASDPRAQIRWYSRQRGIPEDRYDVTDSGEVVYRAEDGNWYRERPGARLTNPVSWAQNLAGGVGPSFAPVAGAAAGIVTAPLMLTGLPGMAASMGAAGAGAAGGELAREGLANLVMDQDVSPSRVAKEGVTSALSQGVGGGLTAWGQRHAAQDIARLDRPTMAALQQTADDLGIPLTPAEVSNLPSLKAQQKMLGNLPQSADKMDDFYRSRAGAIDTRVGQFLDEVSQVDSPEIAGQRVRDAAGNAIKQAKLERSNAAKGLYAGVDDPTNVVPPDKFGPIGGDEFLMDLIRQTKASKLHGMKDMPDNSLPVLDAVKKQLDDMIGGAKPNEARLLRQKREALLGVTDDVFKDFYPAAREAFAGKSPAVNAMEKGLVGIIQKLPDTNLKSAAEKLFDPKGPRAVAEARGVLEKADPDAWQAIKRAWLQEQWEKAGKETLGSAGAPTNQGAKFRLSVMGSEPQRRLMQAMLSGPEYAALDDLSRVLEAAGRVKPIGSDTAWNQEMMRVARQEAVPGIAKMARILRPQDWGKLIEDWATERGLRNRAGDLAELITQPGALAQIKALKRLPPSSARFRAALAHFLTTSGRGTYALGTGGVEGEIEPD